MSKEIGLKWLILTSIIFSTVSCQPDPPTPPPQPPPGMEWRHLDDNAYLTSASIGVKANNVIPLCVNPGHSCLYVRPGSPSIGIPAAASIQNFRNYYSQKNIAGYFANDPYWQQIFPTLAVNQSDLSKIINGVYHTWMPTPNSSYSMTVRLWAQEHFLLHLY